MTATESLHRTLAESLAEFGLSAELRGGVLTLTKGDGLSCQYSARTRCPVVMPGVPDGWLAVEISQDRNAATFFLGTARMTMREMDSPRRAAIQIPAHEGARA